MTPVPWWLPGTRRDARPGRYLGESKACAAQRAGGAVLLASVAWVVLLMIAEEPYWSIVCALMVGLDEVRTPRFDTVLSYVSSLRI